LDRVVDQAGLPQQGHHLAVGPDRAPVPSGGRDQAADDALESVPVDPARGGEGRHGACRVQGHVIAPRERGGHAGAVRGQPGLDGLPVRRGGDHDGRPAAVKHVPQVARYPVGKFLVAIVELDDVTAVQAIHP
jgi:hypothetical protein